MLSCVLGRGSVARIVVVLLLLLLATGGSVVWCAVPGYVGVGGWMCGCRPVFFVGVGIYISIYPSTYVCRPVARGTWHAVSVFVRVFVCATVLAVLVGCGHMWVLEACGFTDNSVTSTVLCIHCGCVPVCACAYVRVCGMVVCYMCCVRPLVCRP